MWLKVRWRAKCGVLPKKAGGGREGRRCQTGSCGYVRAMFAYVRAMFALVRLGPHCNGGSHGLRRCARRKCIQRVSNRIVMVASRWLWVVGLRRCDRGKCVQRVASHLVMVLSISTFSSFFLKSIKGASKNDSHFFLTLTFPLAVLNAHCPVPIGLPLVPPGLRLVCAWSITLSLHWSAPGLRLVYNLVFALVCAWSAPGLRLACPWSISLCLLSCLY